MFIVLLFFGTSIIFPSLIPTIIHTQGHICIQTLDFFTMQFSQHFKIGIFLPSITISNSNKEGEGCP